LRELCRRPREIFSLAFTQDDRLLAIGSGTTVLLLDMGDVQSGQQEAILEHDEEVVALAFSRDD
jgi:hypothetical protein